MRILGVDPSSSCTGIALLEDDQLLLTDVWTPKKTGSAATSLMLYFRWMEHQIKSFRPDMAVVELVAVHRNMNTVRVLARYEAATIIALKTHGVLTMQARVSSARSHTLGKGNLPKEEVYELVKKREPKHKWRGFKSGGGDEADAYVLACAAVEIAEGA